MAEPCTEWRGLLAEHALVGLDDANRIALDAHLEGCAACRASLAELRTTAGALERTDARDLVTQQAVPEHLAAQISARFQKERALARRRRRILTVAGAAAAVVIIGVVGLALSRAGDDAPPAVQEDPVEVVALAATGVDASAALDSKSWGTEIVLSGGFAPGEEFFVWLERADGSRVPAGSFTGIRADSITVTLASSLQTDQAVAVGITSGHGEDLARTELT